MREIGARLRAAESQLPQPILVDGENRLVLLSHAEREERLDELVGKIHGAMTTAQKSRVTRTVRRMLATRESRASVLRGDDRGSLEVDLQSGGVNIVASTFAVRIIQERAKVDTMRGAVTLSKGVAWSRYRRLMNQDSTGGSPNKHTSTQDGGEPS